MRISATKNGFARSVIKLVAVAAVLLSGQASAQTFIDTFSRPDSADLGNGWLEKQPGAFSLVGAEARKNGVGSDYLDNVVYRPAAESAADVEVSYEMEFDSDNIGYPLLLARVQNDTVANGGQLDAYVLYMDNSPSRAIVGRQRGSAFIWTLGQLYLVDLLNSSDTFRMRLRVTGTNPVQVQAWVERQTGSGWEVLAEATISDNDGNRIDSPGTVGFGGYIESGYAFDNFTSVDLGGGPVDNPVPATSGLNPTEIAEGSPGFTLTVQGTDFVPGATVRWNGADRATTYVSDSEIQAAIAAGDVATANTASVTVFNPAPGGGLSNAQAFTITAIPGNPIPGVSGITPNTATTGDAGFVLTINGSGFIPESVVRWDGADRATNYVSASQLTATINAADISLAGTYDVSVFNPGPGGGLSNLASFNVNDPQNPVPVATTLVPASALEGSGAFTLTVQGQSFTQDSVVRWDGADRTTTFISATELQADIAAADLAAAGTVDVSVFTPAPGGGTSGNLTFTVQNAGGGNGNGDEQELLSITPSSLVVNSGDIQLTLNGYGFTQDSVAQLEGISLQTTYVSENELLADIDETLLISGLRGAITVRTADATNVVTAPQTLFVLEDDEAMFSDNFNRPDDADLGNGWTEKDPSVFSLQDGTVTGVATPYLGFNHVITYRPDAEDTRDVEVGMEFVRQVGSASRFPQVHARVQRDTVIYNGLLQSYTLFFDAANSTNGRLHITPINDWYECYIATWDLTQPFQEGERYRLRFRVIGQNPVEMIGYLDWLNEDFWQVVASGTVLHDINTPQGLYCNNPGGMIDEITTAGAAGFAKYRDPSDAYDNFYAIRLGQQANPLPTTDNISPAAATTGGAAFELTVQGTNFLPGSVVRWGGADRPTTYVSPTELRANIDANDIAVAGNVLVTVVNAAPGGGESNPQTFTITDPVGNPVPSIALLSPDMVVVDSAGFTLDVVGNGFVPGSVVRWNGADRATAYVSPTQLQAAIGASDISSAGTAQITVFNPAPGGGLSGIEALTILDPGTDYFDDFSRPDDQNIGSGWIEKNPASTSLVGGRAVKNAVTTGYRDNIVYRPAAENVLDVEASVELEFDSNNWGYPQLLVRIQTDTADAPNVTDAYMLYVDNSPSRVNIGRQVGSGFVRTLNTVYLDELFDTTSTYRLRMRATGTNPVVLDAFVERLGPSGWYVIGQETVTDNTGLRINSAGSVGFGGYVEGTYSFDNFNRLNLTP